MTYPLIHEASYQQEMQETVLPALEKARTAGTFERLPGERLYYELYRPAEYTAWVVICHGFCECIPRYAEVIWYFLRAGYAVAIPEHQGHGRSFRKVKELWLTHVEHFDDYAEDFTYFLKQIVFPTAGEKPVYLFAHSMGGAVGVRTLERTPDLPFRRVVLSSPMISPQTGGLPKWLTLVITRFFILLGRGDRCLFNQSAYADEDGFESDWCCTTSRPRYEWVRRLVAAHPELQNCSASYRWLQEAVLITDKILAEADRITLPTLLCQAGKDTMVHLKPQDAFLRRLPNGRKASFPEAKHETFRCHDDTVERFFETVLSFFGEA